MIDFSLHMRLSGGSVDMTFVALRYAVSSHPMTV
jgi:hypothetical protein